jgi:hypothetical protein
MGGMAEWWSIEVFHGEIQAASRWKDSFASALTESAVTTGAVDWAWIEHRHGVVFEVCFPDDAQWEAFRALPVVRAALDAVPDPVNGLLVYRGRGGGSGARSPRRPRPTAGAGAVELPEPSSERVLDLTAVTAAEVARDLAGVAPGRVRERPGAVPGGVREPAAGSPDPTAAPGPARDLCPAV